MNATSSPVRHCSTRFLTAFVLASTSIVPITPALAETSDAVIYRLRTGLEHPEEEFLWGGRYSVFANFQKRLQDVLTACGKPTPYVVAPGTVPDGKIGAHTRDGIVRATRCPAMANLPVGSPAREGAITQAAWSAVMGAQPAPTLDERIGALILTFEATDFGLPPEWNFCQSGPHDNPTAPGFVCYNKSDPCSFLTWGPHGATVGNGREIQWILWLTRQTNPALVDDAFGSEKSTMQRFLSLRTDPDNKCPNDTAGEKFMCTVWITPARQAIWNDAIAKLGTSSIVRSNYDRLFRSNEFDGGKIKRFFRMWSELGLTATQADYAYFFDRATQTSGPSPDEDTFQAQVAEVRNCVANEPSSININARARRCYSLKHRSGKQPDQRLGRDVAFYMDQYPALTDEEAHEWGRYKRITIGDLAITDATPYGAFTAPSIGSEGPTPNSENLTPEEKIACPTTVLNPIRD
jgi:hypothetical protein